MNSDMNTKVFTKYTDQQNQNAIIVFFLKMFKLVEYQVQYSQTISSVKMLAKRWHREFVQI